MNVHSLGQDQDARSFVSSHQRRLLQELSQIAVDGGVPAENAFQRQPIHLRVGCFSPCQDIANGRPRGEAGPAAALVRVGRIERIGVARAWGVPTGIGLTIGRQAKQTGNLGTPRIQLARGLGIRVDDGGGRAHALQADGLPHDHHFVVSAGRNDDQIARIGLVNRRLNRTHAILRKRGGAADVNRRLAADRNSHGVDRLYAVAGRDEQFTALLRCRPRCVLGLLLYGTRRHAGWHSDSDLCVTPTRNRRSFPTDGHAGQRIARPVARGWTRALSPEAIVAGNGFLIEWCRCGRGPGVPVVSHGLVAQRLDRQGLAGCAHPRSYPIAVDFADRRRGCRVGAVNMVVALGEGGRGHDWRIQVLGCAGHERQLVTELAVARVEQRIGGR